MYMYSSVYTVSVTVLGFRGGRGQRGNMPPLLDLACLSWNCRVKYGISYCTCVYIQAVHTLYHRPQLHVHVHDIPSPEGYRVGHLTAPSLGHLLVHLTAGTNKERSIHPHSLQHVLCIVSGEALVEPGLPQVTVLLGHWMTQDLLKQWTLERVRLCGCVCVCVSCAKVLKLRNNLHAKGSCVLLCL